MLNSNNIKKYLILLIAIFLVSSVLTNLFFFNVINKISIESDLYQKIKSSNDLKADIFPPKLYIIESYLVVQQIANEKDPDKINEYMEKMVETRQEYQDYYQKWQKNINDKDILKLLASSNMNVNKFYQIYDEKFVPAVENRNYQVMQDVANTEMMPVFERHRDAIDRMSVILEESNYNIETNAKAYVNKSQAILIIVYSVSLLVILIISFVFYKKVSDIEENNLASQHETKLANQRLEVMVEGLKKFKHSYENTLASIDGYVMSDDNDGLKNYLNEIIVDKNKNETINYFKLNFIKNPAITGLIISKMIYAENLGVKLVLKVHSEVDNIKMKSSHLCEILGILLDNAIEAAGESDEKKVYFKIGESVEEVIFKIKNSIGVVADPVKMFEKNWSTKGENRGFGLWIAKDIINQYDNVILNTSVDEKYVEQDLLILKDLVTNNNDIFTDNL